MSARDYDEDIDLSDMPYADDDGIMHWPNNTPDDDQRERAEQEADEMLHEVRAADELPY